MENATFIIVFTRDRAPKKSKSVGLGPPSFMCARYYVLAFLVLPPPKNEKKEILFEKVRTKN